MVCADRASRGNVICDSACLKSVLEESGQSHDVYFHPATSLVNAGVSGDRSRLPARALAGRTRIGQNRLFRHSPDLPEQVGSI